MWSVFSFLACQPAVPVFYETSLRKELVGVICNFLFPRYNEGRIYGGMLCSFSLILCRLVFLLRV